MGNLNIFKKRKAKEEQSPDILAMIEYWKQELGHDQYIRTKHYNQVTARIGKMSGKAESWALLASLYEGRCYTVDRKINEAFFFRCFRSGNITHENCVICSSPEEHEEKCEQTDVLEYYDLVYAKMTEQYMKFSQLKRDMMVNMDLQRLRDNQEVDMKVLLKELDRIPNWDTGKLAEVTRRIKGLQLFQSSEYFALKTNLERLYNEQMGVKIQKRNSRLDFDRKFIVTHLEEDNGEAA
ncbi:unnamed protein product [Caenorhabditis brenneri]